jgi:serine/threonine protein kinase
MESGDLYGFVHQKTIEFDWSLKLKIAIDIANGMAFLHSAKPPIVHRDLKSPNVLVITSNVTYNNHK